GLARRFPTEHLLAAGIEEDHAQAERLRGAPPGAARVALVGTSRLQAVLAGAPGAAEPAADGSVVVGAFAHGGLEPFAVRALADRLAGLRVDVAVLHLSEFDTHRAPGAHPATSGGSLAAVGDLAAALGPAIAWQSRVWLERLALASVFAAYR